MDASLDKTVELLSQVGFPIVVAVYFIFSLNKTLQSLVLTVQSLEKTVEYIGKGVGGKNIE